MSARSPRYGHGPDAAFAGAKYTPEEVEFLRAIDHYKRTKRRPFPTWQEVLNVLKSLGWRKVPAAGSPAPPAA